MPRYWLMKSEPDVYAIGDLARDVTTHWEGVRNYQARNSMRDDMQVGDRVLFYHSNAGPEGTGVAGVAQVHRAAYPDDTAWDPTNHYHDPTCPPGEPRWLRVDVAFEARFPVVVTLATLKANPALNGMLVTKRGQRLSVQPVSPEHFDEVLRMARELGLA